MDKRDLNLSDGHQSPLERSRPGQRGQLRPIGLSRVVHVPVLRDWSWVTPGDSTWHETEVYRLVGVGPGLESLQAALITRYATTTRTELGWQLRILFGVNDNGTATAQKGMSGLRLALGFLG